MKKQNLLLDRVALIFKNAKIGSKLTLSPQQQEAIIELIRYADSVTRNREKAIRVFKEFIDQKAYISPKEDIMSFFVADWAEFRDKEWNDKEVGND